jgi:outer membrane biosynthesis protein TonB
MFEKSVETLKAAEAAIAAELEALWVPWDGQAGGEYWHHAAGGALKDALATVTVARTTLETKEPPVTATTIPPTAEVVAPEPEAAPEVPAEAPAEVPVDAPVPEEAPAEAPVEEPVNPSPVPEPEPVTVPAEPDATTTAVTING